MSFIDSVKQAVEIVKLNGKVTINVSKDKNATLMGVLIVAIGAILNQILDFNVLTSIFVVVFAIAVYFIVLSITHALARLFGGQAKYMEYFRAESYAAILGWLGVLAIIPFLGNILNFLFSLWSIVVSVVILENVHKLARRKAIMVVLVFLLLVVIGSLAYFGTLSPDVPLPITP
ncbi:MAG: YIP1 family protein [Flavobacteriales bacterium]|jgi:hypothetical protein|nr:YIP1 family protein [Flavobacteriales bacterium]|tara:strand:- start:1005 stop:1529 length:525 start_codon:yes stop_codon:yes gene_type:complete